MTTTKDKIIVKSLDKEKTEGGIYIGDYEESDPLQKGIVKAIGPEVEGINVGDTLMFKRVAGQKFKISNIEYVWLKKEHALAICNED